MLTRLKVSGFKNLVDVDVRFGPFTCIAGPNGVGKSNLFDAIRFLSALADRPLIEAAMSVRDETGKTADIRSLFYRHGDQTEPQMSFEAEMIIPTKGIDDLGQPAKASSTFLQYSVVLSYKEDKTFGSVGALQLLKEELLPITLEDTPKKLLFPHSYSKWRKHTVISHRYGIPFISTNDKSGDIELHQDGRGGKKSRRKATDLPRTVLSATNATESPTALLARREMQSWQLLQLEPSALRKPDEFRAPTKLGSNGSYIAATINRLASQEANQKSTVYAQIANRLSELVDDVSSLYVDPDEKRQLLTLYVTGKDKTPHAARALSDGTLRFLALAVLAQDQQAKGVLCLEEPENGIHPARIPAIIQLLRDFATDPNEPIGPDNPLRQVIVNTHSPPVVQQVPEDTLLIAEIKEFIHENNRMKGACFSCLPDTWRIKKSANPEKEHICSMGTLLDYLNPVRSTEYYNEISNVSTVVRRKIPRRVVDRLDVQPLLPYPPTPSIK